MERLPIPPQTVRLEEGALANLADVLIQAEASRVFLVVDELAYQLSGAEGVLAPLWATRQVTRFSGFEPNPKVEDVERGVALCRSAEPDLIVALGGGSAIDLAKMISAMALLESSPREIALEDIPLNGRAIPMVAIPTTAGTGSEATHFAVLYIDSQKYSIAADCLLPRWAIVDPALTHTVPSKMTAATGLDAFCQGIESIWAVGSTEESLGYALEAARLAYEHLADATHRPDAKSRAAMCRAAHLAGKAINISKTTLPHAISYALTSDYGIPHGAAVGTTLSAVLAFNRDVSEEDCTDPRGAVHVRTRIEAIYKILGASDTVDACQRIERFIASLDCPPSLASIGIDSEEQLRSLARRVNVQRMANNPRAATPEQLLTILGGGSVSSVAPTTSEPS